MKLTGTSILRCLARKVNSGGKETYVTNLLVLDPDNSTGTNYAVEVWDEKPHELRLMSEIALTVTGVVNKNSGVPASDGTRPTHLHRTSSIQALSRLFRAFLQQNKVNR